MSGLIIMKFEVSPIILKTKTIEAFDANLSFSINVKEILQSYTFVSHIDNLYLLFSSDEEDILNHLHKYFTFDSNIATFSQIHLFLFIQTNEIMQLKRDSLFYYKNNAVKKGKNLNENIVFLINDSVYIEKDVFGSMTKIYFTHLDDLKCSYPIIIKIIESIITEYFLIRGFLPMHCSVGRNRYTEQVYLVFGESKSGKTTYFTENKYFELIGDEYCFYREDKIIPFNLYYKSYCWKDEDFDEDFGGLKRKVYKMSSMSERQVKSIDKIIYIKNEDYNNLQIVEDDVKISILLEYLSNFPGKIYLNNVKRYFPLVISTTRDFLEIPMYLK